MRSLFTFIVIIMLMIGAGVLVRDYQVPKNCKEAIRQCEITSNLMCLKNQLCK